MMMLRSHSWLLIPALLSAGSAVVRPAPDGTVTALSLSSSGGTARFAIGVTGSVTVREVTYSDPDRLVLDLEGATLGELAAYDGLKRGAVRAIRARQHSEHVVRVVLEFDGLPAYTLDKGTAGLIIVAFADKAFERWAATPAPTPPAALAVSAPAPGGGDARILQRASTMLDETPRSLAAVQDDRPITVTFNRTPIQEVIEGFAEFSGRSIVLGSSVTGEVTMKITNTPWPYAFEAVLATQGLSAQEMRGGIIRVDSPGALAKLDSVEVLQTRMLRLNYSKAGDVAAAAVGLITKNRGSIIADSSSNSLIITDTRTRITSIIDFVQGMDTRTPMIAIEAKIIYVDRTDLAQLGLKYDIGTSQSFFNKLIQRTDPTTGQPFNPNVNVVNLGGNAVSAISNADALITGSALDLVFSTAIGGFSITSFLSALERVELTDVEATPLVHTLNDRQATIFSGED